MSLLTDIRNLISLYRDVSKNDLHFEYDNDISRVVITASEPSIKSVRLSKRIATVLGFDSTDLTSDRNGKIIADTSPDLSFGATRLFVYSDILESQLVGDTFAPLLYSFPLKTDAYDRETVTNTVKKCFSIVVP